MRSDTEYLMCPPDRFLKGHPAHHKCYLKKKDETPLGDYAFLNECKPLVESHMETYYPDKVDRGTATYKKFAVRLRQNNGIYLEVSGHYGMWRPKDEFIVIRKVGGSTESWFPFITHIVKENDGPGTPSRDRSQGSDQASPRAQGHQKPVVPHGGGRHVQDRDQQYQQPPDVPQNTARKSPMERFAVSIGFEEDQWWFPVVMMGIFATFGICCCLGAVAFSLTLRQ